MAVPDDVQSSVNPVSGDPAPGVPDPVEPAPVDRVPDGPSSVGPAPVDTVSDSPPWGLTTKAIVASAALILIALIIWRFRFLLPPLITAGILAYLLNPLINWIQKRGKLRRSYAVLTVYLCLLVLWAGVGIAAGVALVDQITRLRDMLPELIPQLTNRTEELVMQLSSFDLQVGPYVFRPFPLPTVIDWNALSQQARQLAQPVVTRSGILLAGLAQDILSTLGLALLVFVISIYISNDAPKLVSTISDVAHQPGYRQDADQLVRQTVVIWNTYLRGQILLAVIIGIVVTVSLWILGVNNALALGIISGILEFLPLIGPVVGTAAAVLVALFQPENTWALPPYAFALLVLAVMVAIQQLENNILVPRIVGDALDLHPIVVMVVVLMGSSLAGLLGAVLAAPVAATFKLLGRYVWRKLLDLPPFPEPDFDPSRFRVHDEKHRDPFARIRAWLERING